MAINRHPGNLLAYMLAEMDMPLSELSARSGLTLRELNQVLAGKLIITPTVAEKLGQVLQDARFWILLQAEYNLGFRRRGQ